MATEQNMLRWSNRWTRYNVFIMHLLTNINTFKLPSDNGDLFKTFKYTVFFISFTLFIHNVRIKSVSVTSDSYCNIFTCLSRKVSNNTRHKITWDTVDEEWNFKFQIIYFVVYIWNTACKLAKLWVQTWSNLYIYHISHLELSPPHFVNMSRLHDHLQVVNSLAWTTSL